MAALLLSIALACDSAGVRTPSSVSFQAASLPDETVVVFDSISVSARDSSGIRVVSNEAKRIEIVPDWSANIQQIVRIGGYQADVNEILSGVSDVQILSDSSLAVANGHFFTVAVFGLDGRWLRNVGQKGKGPGEYQNLSSLDLCDSGSLMVVDILQRRLTFLSPALEYEKNVKLVDAHSDSSPYAAECASEGRIVVLGRWIGWPIDIPLGPHEVPVFLSLLNSSEKSIPWGRAGGMDRYRQETQDGPSYFGGSTAVAESRGHVFVTHPTEPTILRYDLNGRLVGVIHTGQQRQRITRSHIEELVDRVEARLRRRTSDAGTLAESRRFFLEYEYADSFPTISGILADDSGRLWVEDYQGSTTVPRRWRILSSEGILQASIVLPPRFDLKVVRGTLLAGVTRDSLDAQVVEVIDIREH